MKRFSLFHLLLAAILLLAIVAASDARWVCQGNRCYWVPDAPAAAPAARAAPAKPPEIFPGGKLPTGVSFEMMDPSRERYSIGGVETDKGVVYGELALANGLVDDSQRKTVSVIDADEARRKTVLAELKAGLGDRFRYWDGAPTDWSFRSGFVTSGAPTIYCQAPNGSVIWRQDSLDEGGVAAAIENIRRRYDPARDPGPSSFSDLKQHLTTDNLLGLGLLVAVGYLLFFRK